MAITIDRTALNALVNDSGLDQDGSVLDKAALAAVIHDPIDDALADVETAIAAVTVPGVTTNGTDLTQLKFAATQVPSTNANTLDDYEEASFTPVIGGSGGTSGQTYSTQVGHVIKIGKLVKFSAYVVFSAKGTITGNVQLQGLPYTSENTSNQYHICNVQWLLATSWVNIMARVAPNSTIADLKGATAAATSNGTALTTADINNATELFITGWYRAAA